MKKKIFIVAAALFSRQLQAQLQEDTTGRLLDEVILTANKYPKKQSETGKVTTVINRQELDKGSGKTLGELLNTAVGTTIIGVNNNLGTNQTVSIRGSSAGNVLILVDGIPVNDPSVNTNHFDLNLFSIDQVERIEILKGGHSTLYGSDAVAGVINIITKKNSPKPFNLSGAFTLGSYNTIKEYIGVTGSNKKINYSLQYSHIGSDGFSAAYDSTGNNNFDKDGFNQHVLNESFGIKLNKNWQARLFGQYSYYKTDLDASAFTDEKDYSVSNKNVQTGAGLIFNHLKGTLSFNYTFNYVSRDYLDDSIFKSSSNLDYSASTYIGRTHFAELYNNWKWSVWELLSGIDFRKNNTYQHYFSNGPFGPYTPDPLKANMSQISPYASLIYKKGNGFTTELGGRWNNHSEYGKNFTYTINPSILINNKVKIFANAYSAFKAPTLYQLFDPLYGNIELDAERSKIFEVGLDAAVNKSFNTRFVGFYRTTKNAIQFIYTDIITFEAEYRNVSKLTNYGMEAEISYIFNKWNFAANYTYTNGKIKSKYDETGSELTKDTTFNNLYRIPKHSINFSIGVQATSRLNVSTHIKAVGNRLEPEYASSPKELDNYYIVDFYAEYRLNKIFKVFTDLKNITNQKYFEFLGYNSRRFNFNTGVTIVL